jgi:hypothetical protein
MNAEDKVRWLAPSPPIPVDGNELLVDAAVGPDGQGVPPPRRDADGILGRRRPPSDRVRGAE